MGYHMGILVGVMLVFGVLGGIINYFLSSSEETTIKKSIIIGIGASFLVPLFLNMISSDLINESRENPYKILVFLGFCLIAAISSSAFIDRVSKGVLKKIDEVKTDVKEIKGEVLLVKDQACSANDEVKLIKEIMTPLMIKETEIEFSGEKELFRNGAAELDDDDKSVLRALANSVFLYRSIEGLSKDAKLDRARLDDIIKKLISGGFAAQSERPEGTRYYITEEGRKIVFSLSSTK